MTASYHFAGAADFVWRNARLLDRHRFTYLFLGGPPDPVLAALRPYQNVDGGFGHALEPDLRGPSSQPVPLEHALGVLDDIDRFGDPMVEWACDWLESVSVDEGGVPLVLDMVDEGPHAPWWVPTRVPSLHPTAGIAGLLRKHGVNHPWVERATSFCWRALQAQMGALGPDDALAALTLLEHMPGPAARRELARLGARILDDLVTLDPQAQGYVRGPLDFAPTPSSPARRLFRDAVIAEHLDALERRQRTDGGWPISWESPSPAAACEWRSLVTIASLRVLDAYGR